MLQGNKVATIANKTMVDALKVCMLLAGLRANQIDAMDQREFDFLKNFIRRHYGGHSIDEIVLAFDLAAAGKLELGSDGAKAYGDFSCEYFGRIMSAYRKFAEQKVKAIEKTLKLLPNKPTPEELLQINVEYAIYLYRALRKKELLTPLKW